jgi:hypothetical protein
MSVMDPLLNLGILWRCLAAYCGIDFQTEIEKYRDFKEEILNDPSISLSSSSATSSSTETSTINNSNSGAKLSNRFSFKYTKSGDSNNNNKTATTATAAKSTELQSKRSSLSSNASSSQFYIDSSSPEKELVQEEIVKMIPAAETSFTASSSPSISHSQSPAIFSENEAEKDNEGDEVEVSKSDKLLFGSNDNLQSKIHSNKERLVQLYKLLGDSVFLIEKMRNHPLTRDPFMSPILTSDEILSKFPRTYLIVSCSFFFFVIII